MEVTLGTIPDGWKHAPLGQLCGRITTGKLDANAMVADGDYPFFTCARESYRIDNYAFDCEALLVSGNGANVGYVHYYNGKFNAYQRTYVLSEFTADVHYLRLFLDRNLQGRIRVEVNAGNTPYITMGTLTEMGIVLPTASTEQRAIAQALSDVDGLLGGLDRLIAKKRDLKQAAMQQLLTGKKRLPGFSGEWEVKRLGDVARLYQPETIAQSAFTSDGYPVYGANGVVGRYSRCNHMTSQITVSCRGNCGTVNRTDGPAWITGNAMVINLDGSPNVNHAFVFYALSHADLTVLVSGSGIPQIVRGPLESFALRFPPLPEQTAIAEVLTEMDAELAALEQRREKTRALKQGMMQKLLTGRTRLV